MRETDKLVAVKVLRPNVEKAFQKDIDAFYLAAWLIEILSPASRRLRPMEVITHFEGVVLGELDLRLESSAASEFAANTKMIGFQLPYSMALSNRRVMTPDWVGARRLVTMRPLRKRAMTVQRWAKACYSCFRARCARWLFPCRYAPVI